MSYIFYDPNPRGRFVGDCVIRAVCKATHQTWRTVHADLADLSDEMCNNMCADEVCRNMLGNGCATPQQALQKLLQDGKINQAQYEQFSRII